MKNLFKYQLFIIAALLFAGCSNDDDNTPTVVNEEEVITTLIAVFTPTTGGGDITFQSQDLDGDGPNAPVVTSGDLAPNTTYNVVVTLLNETENPAEDITEEVEEESDEHQMFYLPSNGLNLSFVYSNFDNNGNPLGTEMVATTGDASGGSFGMVLRHEPTKPNNGTLPNAGGETDISVTFPVTIQ
ncbi:MAG: type 1 periplasmic binding fold superfamily protein [Bacteroidota bacterium]